MKEITINNLMVPIEEYATVSEDATLADAIQALERAQQAFDHTKYRHRAILVLGKDQRPIGKISQLDALKALEPKYKQIQGEDPKNTFRHFNRMFIKSMLKDHSLFEKPLADLRNKAASTNVKAFMYALSKEDCVSQNATLNEAIHILVMGTHHSLLVSSNQDEIVGILRLTDVFAAVFQSLTATSE